RTAGSAAARRSEAPTRRGSPQDTRRAAGRDRRSRRRALRARQEWRSLVPSWSAKQGSTGTDSASEVLRKEYSPCGPPSQLPGASTGLASFRNESWRGPEPTSHLEQHVEAAVDQPLAVERHRVDARTQPGVSHHLLHALVTHLARRPGDPRKDDRLILLA